MCKLLRRPVWALCLVAACTTSFAQETVRVVSTPVTSVDVNLRFNDRQPSALLVESMQVEAEAIWRIYGVDLHWHFPPAPQLDGSQLFDVLLDQRHHGRARAALGDARLPARGDEAVAIRLDREAIEDELKTLTFDQLAHLTHHAQVGAADLGRALGRVLAHEIGHALLDTRAHRASGLMRPAFTGEELLAGERTSYGLSAAEVARLVSLLRAHRHYLARGDDSANSRRPSRSRTVRSGAMVSCSGG